MMNGLLVEIIVRDAIVIVMMVVHEEEEMKRENNGISVFKLDNMVK